MKIPALMGRGSSDPYGLAAPGRKASSTMPPSIDLSRSSSEVLDTSASGDNSPPIARSRARSHTDRVRRGLIGDLHGARRRVLLALSSFTLALPVDGLRQPIREFRGGQGQVHGQSISDETAR
jgi:hypothetical protein